MGILGPTIRAEVNDKVIIHFKNLASRPYSIHPYGISYWKMSEGASYNDHTSASEKEDDVVKPKGEYVYVWEITDNLGPLDGDSRCLTSAYSSHVDQVRDFNSGLIGAILICKHGTLNSLGKQVNQQEFVLLFSVIDESKSWYLETDRIKYKIPGPRKSKRLMYSINGYINSSLPDLNLCKNRDVSWHLIAMGSVPNLFSIYFSGNGLLLRGHRVVSIELAPTAFTTAEMSPSSKSKWLLSCQNPEHQQGRVADNDKDNFNIQMKYMMRTMSTKQRPIEWIHYITAEECDWDYNSIFLKKRLKNLEPSEYSLSAFRLRSQKLERNPNRIGKEYKKAVYVEYTDNTFTIVKYKPNPKSSKGILGPVLRGEVGDRFKIVFKNLASRPYNLNPHGLTKIKVETAGDHHVMNHSVQPNEVVTYFWNVTESDGPTQSDPGCQTHFYFSSVDVVRDMASGLIGPMLICRKEMLNMNIKIDRSKYLLLSLFDENKSWYINENIQKYCEEPSSVNTKDPEFYQSNLMYSINGFVNESAPNLDFCLKEDIFWHVIVGAQNDILSLYFHGQTFKRDGIYEDVLTLFPFSGETIRMDMDNIGQWLLKPLNYQYQSRGMRAKFTVRNCDNEEENYENLVNFINTEEEDLVIGFRVQQLRGQRLGNKFKKVVFQQYMDNTFRQPVIRGEFEEHLGILGPVIIAEVNEIIVVKFKNMASKPFSIHAHGVSRDIPEEYMDEEEKVIWPRKEEDIAYPNETKMYIWHVTKGSAPTNKDFDCRAWTYYSDVNPERDIHSGLIGPLIVCKAGTLNKVSDMTPKVQEFSLLFLTFDENKSWYLEDNIQIFCKTPCHIRPESPTFRASNRFHTINGYVAETLPGLVMAQYRLVRWYLINMAMSAEIYSVHFHSQPFAMRRTKEHRMGVYTLFPGSFGTIEMYPTKVGYWLLDCETSVHQQAGMRAISLVYNPRMYSFSQIHNLNS
uniref:Coagulation factor VIII n=1 Tax=Callorhinchus milii TaxID=7868 RepID=A0A4W3GTS2_CALMI